MGNLSPPFLWKGFIMKDTILYVFSVITSLIVAGILWACTIGFPTDKGIEAGYVGSKTVFKTGLFDTLRDSSTNYESSFTDNNGVGYSERTKTIWDGATVYAGDTNISCNYSNGTTVLFGDKA